MCVNEPEISDPDNILLATSFYRLIDLNLNMYVTFRANVKNGDHFYIHCKNARLAFLLQNCNLIYTPNITFSVDICLFSRSCIKKYSLISQGIYKTFCIYIYIKL